LGQFWVGATNVMIIGIHGSRRTARLLPVYGLGVLVNIALLMGLAPSLGVGAAGLAFLGGSVTSALLAGWYSNSLFNTGFRWRLVASALCGSVLLLWMLQAGLELRRLHSGSIVQAALDLALGAAVTVPLVAGVIWMGCGTKRARGLIDTGVALVRRGRTSA
jgi:hypothetical protein